MLGMDDEIKMFCIDDNLEAQIDIAGTDEGTMDFEFRVFDADGNMTTEYAAYDVPVTEQTRMIANSDYKSRDAVLLSVDNDGDDKEDLILEAKKQSILTLTASEGGYISKGVNGKYGSGDDISLSAKPNEGYVFEEWLTTAGGSFEDNKIADTLFSMPSNDTEVTATFEKLDISMENPEDAFKNDEYPEEGNLKNKDANSNVEGKYSQEAFNGSNNFIYGIVNEDSVANPEAKDDSQSKTDAGDALAPNGKGVIDGQDISVDNKVNYLYPLVVLLIVGISIYLLPARKRTKTKR